MGTLTQIMTFVISFACIAFALRYINSTMKKEVANAKEQERH
jgi:hypothetical protein